MLNSGKSLEDADLQNGLDQLLEKVISEKIKVNDGIMQHFVCYCKVKKEKAVKKLPSI